MAKRGRRGYGSVYRRGPQLWVAQVTKNGKKDRRYARTRAEAEAMRLDMLDVGPRRRGGQSIEAFLDSWFDRVVRDTIRPSSVESYGTAMNQIKRHIGDVPLSEVNAETIALLQEQMRTHLSPGSIRRNHGLFKRALRYAVAQGFILSNPLEGQKAPRYEMPEASALDEEELARLLEAAQGTRWYALWMVLGHLGLRIGEALGLRWSDIDRGWDIMRVTHQLRQVRHLGYELTEPKSKKARRPLILTPCEVAALQAHRELILAERRLPFEDHDLIFPTANGGYMHRQIADRALRLHCFEANLAPITPHQLRHTFATIMLKHNVPIKVVSEMLGHSDIVTTLRIYVHVTEGMQRDAAARRAEIWSGTSSAERATMG